MFKECKKMIKGLKVYKVEQTKGLEFNTVYVLTTMMNENEKYISYSRALYKLVMNLGGSISAEHGIGITKLKYFQEFIPK